MKVTFKELYDVLNESPIAGYGDWNPTRDRVAIKSHRALKADWHKIDDVSVNGVEFDVYKSNESETYIMGVLDEEGFETVFHIKLKHRPDVENDFKEYKNIHNVDGVMVKKDRRGYSFATFFYKYLLEKRKMIILGDEIQYHKARLLWAKLSHMDDVVVDIIDIDKAEIIEKDVVLYHGEADYEFDETLYDYSDIKKNIRLVLTKVL